MKSRAIFLSSEKNIELISSNYKANRALFWVHQFLFELSNLSARQKKILKNLNNAPNHSLRVHQSQDQTHFLLQFLTRQLDYSSINANLPYDQELFEFFNKVNTFLSNPAKPIWKIRNQVLDFNAAPMIMGILNVTPDSFSDGGNFFDKSKAVDRALSMVEESADIIDIGGESTRPGSEPVKLEAEKNRVLPVIEEIRKHSDILISIDTYKSTIADAALEMGADIINDISGCSFDAKMSEVVLRNNCPLIIMHIKGTPKNMQQNPEYENVISELYDYFDNKIIKLKELGIEKLIIDPGIGFGKRLQDNLNILNNLPTFTFLDTPILIGTSRKSFIGKILDKEVDHRINGSLATAVISIRNGADIVRVHDIRETKEVIEMMKAVDFPAQY